MTEPTFLSQLTGCFATPIAENPTVAMMEAGYRHHDLNARYINCEVSPENLAAAIRGAAAMGWLGFHCSLPHKVAVVPLLDEMAESATLIGAVNCVVIDDGRLRGENTDGKGFLASLRTVADPRGKSVVVLGAGGAARAVCVELALAGAAHITVVNRSAPRGTELVALIGSRTPATAVYQSWESTVSIPAGADIVVDATSIGLYPAIADEPDIDYDTILPGMVVADVVANPPRTAFLTRAATRGATTLDGLGMLVNQGVLSIELWTGVVADPAPMRLALEEILG
jgi:shikimate dehydrogenase